MALHLRDTYSVFVGHIGPDIVKDDLRQLFKGCGPIADIVIMEDQKSLRKPFGFVRFLDKDCAFRAVSELNGWLLKGSPILVDISKDTLEKIKGENGNAVKMRHLKSVSTRNHAPSSPDLAKDTMYFNRLKESLTSFGLQYSQKQVNFKRLLSDIGPTSCFCHTRWASIKEPVSFEKVSAKLMEKCSGSDEKGKFSEQRGEEFKKSLQIIVSEISHVIDLNKWVDRDIKDKNTQDKVVFDSHVLPKSVQIIQKLEKCSRNIEPDNETYLYKSGVKSEVESEIVTGTMKKDGERGTECLPELDKYHEPLKPTFNTDVQLKSCAKMLSNSDGESSSETLNYNCSKLQELQLSLQKFETDQDVDPLELLYMKMNSNKQDEPGTMQRSNSRDSSISEDSVEGNINDSGIECDVTRPLLPSSMQAVHYECNRAAGRARALDQRIHRKRNGVGQQANTLKQEFSLETYILQSMGRGRGMSANSSQTTTVPQDQQKPTKPLGRGFFSDSAGPP